VTLKAYKFRLYPNRKQEVLMAKTFGCVRFVYNKALGIKTAIYQTEKRNISVFDLTNQMVEWKKQKEYAWLSEVNSQSLQMSLRNLDSAFTLFYKDKNKYPVFKNKYSKQSFQNPQYTKVNFEKNKVFLPKFKDGITCIFHRKFEGKIKTSTVTKTASGKYFIAILVEVEDQIPEKLIPSESKALGIDLGLKHFATYSDGTRINNPKFLKNKLKKLKKLQRRLSKKKKDSNNRKKQKIKVAKLHEKISNSRKNFLHKITNNLVENQNYTSFVIEDLAISNMMKNSRLSRAIADVSWFSFKEMLSYKCKQTGKNLLVIGKFEPSSKLCPCGQLNNDLTLKDRNWTCKYCKVTHDRDLLAANNIKHFAFIKEKIPQELRESKPVESCISILKKQET
jgi:putative transposase